jgi:putative PEP-CTERM system histidine kinase
MISTTGSLAVGSYALATFANLALLLILVLRWRKAGLVPRALATAVAMSAMWAGLMLAYSTGERSLSLPAAYCMENLRVGAWYAFMLLLMRQPTPRTAAQGRGAIGVHSGLLAAAAAVVVVGLTASALMLFNVRGLGDPGRLWLLDAVASAVLGAVLVEQLLRNVTVDSRWNVKPLCLALAAMYFFDLYYFSDALLFNRFDADIFIARGFMYALVTPLIAVAAGRGRDGAPAIVLSRRIAFHSAALVASGIYLLFMAAAGYYVRYFGGDWGRALQLALAVAALLALGALALSGSMRARLRVQVSKHFFRYRYDYRDEWLRFTQALSAHASGPELEQRVVRALADMVESPAGSLWLRDAGDRVLKETARWNMPATTGEEKVDGALCKFLLTSGWVINLEEFRSSPARYGNLTLPGWLSGIPSAWLVVPLANADELLGFVLLATARTHVDVNWEVNDLLKTAGRQAATFLGQMRASEALLEARKFDAFNRMSAFVVHDLKNIVAQLSLMLRNAERHSANPDFQKDMLMTVEHSVERMKQLMLQLREGTTPIDAPRGVDLGEIVRGIVRSKSTQESEIELQMGEQVLAKGHPHRLERVIGHIVQNALDASRPGSRVWVRLEANVGQAMVEVGDRGHGMTPEFVRERLFKPFQTTKPNGMGIGAYESYQYVQELGGRILVESTPDVGTRVRLLLPLFEQVDSSAENSRVAA